MRRRRKGLTTEAWAAARHAVWVRQAGRCARCGWAFRAESEMDAAHVRPLGMGRSRHRPGPLNEPGNLLGLCRGCHVWFDGRSQEERLWLAEGWMDCGSKR